MAVKARRPSCCLNKRFSEQLIHPGGVKSPAPSGAVARRGELGDNLRQRVPRAGSNPARRVACRLARCARLGLHRRPPFCPRLVGGVGRGSSSGTPTSRANLYAGPRGSHGLHLQMPILHRLAQQSNKAGRRAATAQRARRCAPSARPRRPAAFPSLNALELPGYALVF